MSTNDSGVDASGAPLTEQERALWDALKRLGEHAVGAVAREIEAASSVSAADFSVLLRIADLGSGALGQATLRAALGWEKSRLSHQLQRMEARGLLARDRTASAGVTLRLLPVGEAALACARPVHAAAIRRLVFRHIAPAEAQLLLDLVARLDAGVAGA